MNIKYFTQQHAEKLYNVYVKKIQKQANKVDFGVANEEKNKQAMVDYLDIQINNLSALRDRINKLKVR